MATVSAKSEFPISVESVLELVEQNKGDVALRPIGAADGESLVSISFSEDIKAYMGKNLPFLAQEMIQVALQMVMAKQQTDHYVRVMDERPTHMS